MSEVLSKVDKPASPEASETVNLKALFSPVSDLTKREYVPSPLFIIVELTPSIASSEFERLFRVAPDDTFTVLEDFAEFDPNVDAWWPIVIVPDPTVEPGVMAVMVLNTLLPVDVFPLEEPVIVSEIEFPAISVPETVNIVLD